MRPRAVALIMLLTGCAHGAPETLAEGLVPMSEDEDRAWAIVETTPGDPRSQVLYACRREPAACIRVRPLALASAEVARNDEGTPGEGAVDGIVGVDVDVDVNLDGEGFGPESDPGVEPTARAFLPGNATPEAASGLSLGLVRLGPTSGTVSPESGDRFWMIEGVADGDPEASWDEESCDASFGAQPQLRIEPLARAAGAPVAMMIVVATDGTPTRWGVRTAADGFRCGHTSDVASVEWSGAGAADVFVGPHEWYGARSDYRVVAVPFGSFLERDVFASGVAP